MRHYPWHYMTHSVNVLSCPLLIEHKPNWIKLFTGRSFFVKRGQQTVSTSEQAASTKWEPIRTGISCRLFCTNKASDTTSPTIDFNLLFLIITFHDPPFSELWTNYNHLHCLYFNRLMIGTAVAVYHEVLCRSSENCRCLYKRGGYHRLTPSQSTGERRFVDGLKVLRHSLKWKPRLLWSWSP